MTEPYVQRELLEQVADAAIEGLEIAAAEQVRLSWQVSALKTHLLFAADALEKAAVSVVDIPTALKLRALAAQFRSEVKGKVKP